jgi:hypothetical protein
MKIPFFGLLKVKHFGVVGLGIFVVLEGDDLGFSYA